LRKATVRRLILSGLLLAIFGVLYLSTRRHENQMVLVINDSGLDSSYKYVWLSPSQIAYIRTDSNANSNLVAADVNSQHVTAMGSVKRAFVNPISSFYYWILLSPKAKSLLVVAPEKEPRYRVLPAGDHEHTTPLASNGTTLDCRWTNDEHWLTLEQNKQGRHLDSYANNKLVSQITVPNASRVILGMYEGNVLRILHGELTRNRTVYDLSTIHLDGSTNNTSTIQLTPPEKCEFWEVWGIAPYHKLVHHTTLHDRSMAFQMKNGWIPSIGRRDTLVDNVWVTDLDGKNPKQILRFEAKNGVYGPGPRDFAPVPGSKQMSFCYDNKIWKVDID
jgi:hypothetical protein